MTHLHNVIGAQGTLVTAALTAGILMAATAPVLAAPWVSINERQAKLDARIDQGVRSGALTQGEANALRSEFRDIAGLEAEYRRSGGGLNDGERNDLNRRMDGLSARIRSQKHDAQHY